MEAPVTGKDRPSPGRVDRAQEIGLFRYALIREAADTALSQRQRGVLVRVIAETEHTGPFGAPVMVSRVTLDRWIRTWRVGGFDALVPRPRGCTPRTDVAVLELAAALKREIPGRTAAQVAAILAVHGGACPSVRTLQRHFVRLELNTRPNGAPPKVFGRFQADAVNDRWTGDALHGPMVGGRKTYLFAFIDDYSRALVGYRWAHSEDTVRLEAALRAALGARGVPKVVYVDNGSAFVSKQLMRALAVMGIRLIHSRPGEPAGRGKIERFFRTVRDQFLVELSTPGALADVKDITALNELFTAWVETVYHHREHSETGEQPLARFMSAGPADLPTPALLAEAFLWSHIRTVTKTATISVEGNIYEVDAALVGRKVEVVFDPFDMTVMAVRYQGRAMGAAVPHIIGRHVHSGAKPDTEAQPAPVTGIDYLNLIAERHQQSLAERINYTNLPKDMPDVLSAAEGVDVIDVTEGAAREEQIPSQPDLATAATDATNSGDLS